MPDMSYDRWMEHLERRMQDEHG